MRTRTTLAAATLLDTNCREEVKVMATIQKGRLTKMGTGPWTRMASGIAAVIFANLSGLLAQGLGPTVRPLCDPAKPRCTGDACKCLDGWLGIEFDSTGRPVVELARFEAGQTVEVTVTLDTSSQYVVGWSFGVRHDPRFLELESLTIEGTDAQRLAPCGFVVLAMKNIEECPADDHNCQSPVSGPGYVAAFAIISDLHLMQEGRNPLHHANYRLTGEDPGAKGTLLRFTDRLKQKGSPPMDIGVVENGLSRSPRFVVDGLIRNAAGDVPFHRGDPSGDGRVNVADVIATLLYLFGGARMPPCLEAADFDDDGVLSIADAVGTLDRVAVPPRRRPRKPGSTWLALRVRSGSLAGPLRLRGI